MAASSTTTGADGASGDGEASKPTHLERQRASLRRTVNSIRWEMGMLIFVLFYFVVVFTTFALDDQKVRTVV